MSVNDSILWQRWQERGDPDAFSEIVSRHSGMVHAACKRILGNAAEADDVTQDCFIELLNGNVIVQSSLAPWLYTVASRRALNRAKSKLRYQKRDHLFMNTQVSSTQIVLDDLLEVVDAAILELPEKLRSSVVCRFLEGQSYEEIAQNFGVAESTVRYRTDKGIERIRSILKRRGIQIGATTLSSILLEVGAGAVAAPATVVATLGKLSIVGSTTSIVAETASISLAGSALTTFGGILVMKKIVVGVVIVTALLVGIWSANQTDDEDTVSQLSPAIVEQYQAEVELPSTDLEVVTVPSSEQESVRAQNPIILAPPSDIIRIAGIVLDHIGVPVAGAKVQGILKGVGKEEVESSSDGTFEISASMISNNLTLVAVKGFYESNALGPMKLRDDGLDGLVLKLDVERAGSIAGSVIDRDGDPVPNVYVYPNRTSGPKLDSAQTNTRGEFKLSNLPADTYSIVLSLFSGRGSSFGEAATTIELSKGQSMTDLELLLDRGNLSITGQIVDTLGNSIKGAKIFVHNGFGGDVSDGTGSFTIAGLDEGSVMIDATHQNYSSSRIHNVSAGSDQIKIVMKGKGSVEGRVIEARSGNPVSKFEVFHTKGGSLDNRQEISNQEGLFNLEKLDVGETTLSVRAKGFKTSSQVLELNENSTTKEVEFRLESGERLDGMVVNAHSIPVDGAYIFIGASPMLQGGMHSARTDSTGKFSIVGFSTEIKQISAYHPDYAMAVENIDSLHAVHMVLEKASTIEGLITKSGKPVAGMMVLAVNHEIQGASSVSISKKDGTYKLDGLSPGATQVIANAQQLRDGKAQIEMLSIRADSRSELDFEFKAKSAYIEGKVTLGGQPARDAKVILTSYPRTGARPQQTQTTSEGYYQFDDVQSGEISLGVSVESKNGQLATRQIRFYIEEEEALWKDIDISLSPSQQISGTVLKGEQEEMIYAVAVFEDVVPLSDTVEANFLMQQIGNALSVVDCAQDGSYVHTGMEPGNYTVVALAIPKLLENPSQIEYIIIDLILTVEEPATIDFDFQH